MDGEHIEMIVSGWSSTSLRESALSELVSMREELANLRQYEKVITLLKERILLAEKKKGEYDTLEMDAFWDGQMRCAQDLLNKVSRLTKRAPDKCPRCNGRGKVRSTSNSDVRCPLCKGAGTYR